MRVRFNTSLLLLVCTLSVRQVVMADEMNELPQGAEIQHGDIDITTHLESMRVDQSSQYGIVDWQSFSIGSGNDVHFNNGAGSTLNRVVGVDVSNIQGSLSATGNLYLLNSNGIIFGENGSVLTGGDFVSSTLNLTNEDFLNGGNLSLFGDNNSSITNLGQISSTGGNVFLSAYSIHNSGSIDAVNGRVGLASGTEIDILTDVSWGNGAYSVKVGERGNDISNEGRISGLVAELRTHNGNIFALAGNNEGLIQATGVNNEGGNVFLTAEQGLVQSSGTVSAELDGNGGRIEIDAAQLNNFGGTQNVSGVSGGEIQIRAANITSDTRMLANGENGDGGTITLEASGEILLTSAAVVSAQGANDGGEIAIDAGAGDVLLSGELSVSAGMRGGLVSLTGDSVAMLGGAIYADGGPQGGEIYLGGGYQGQAIPNSLTSTANASSTYVSETSLLNADAGYLGKGGTVVVWADGTTQFAGQINARGGIEGGDGGLVETSGLENLGVSGTVDASARAAYGEDGSWLLDPLNINIEDITDSFTEFLRISDNGDGLGFRTDRTAGANEGAQFGSSVDISGNTAVVGVGRFSSNSFDFPSSNSNGAAYIFEDGEIAARLTGAGPFGRLVGIEGTDVVVTGADGLSYFQKGTGWRNGTANLFNTFLAGTPANYAALVSDPGDEQSRFYLSDPTFTSGGHDIGAVFIFQPASLGFVETILATSGGTETAASLANQGFGTHLAADDGWLFAGWAAGTQQNTYYVRDVDRGFGFERTVTQSSSITNGAIQNGFTAIGSTLYTVTFGTDVSSYGHQLNSSNITSLGRRFVGSASGTISSIAADNASNVLLIGSHTATPTGGGTPSNRVGFYNSADFSLLHEVFLPGDNSGPIVAIDGLNAIAGITKGNPIPTDAGKDIGTAYLFTATNGSDWSGGADQTIVAPAARDEGFQFGDQIKVDGDTFVISDPNAGNVNFPSSTIFGEVYVYENNALAAVLQAPLTTTGSAFGLALDLDGDTIAITDTAGTGLASLQIFEKGAGWANGSANRTAILNADSGFNFGGVGLEDGVVAVAARSGGQIDLDIYDRGQGSWQTAFNAAATNTLIARPATATAFAIANLELENDTVAIGWGDNIIHLYQYDVSNWALAPVISQLAAPESGQTFGDTFDLSGNTLVAPGRTTALGTGTFVFERATDWSAVTTPVAQLGRGTYAAIDGDLIVAGNNVLSFYYKQNGWQDGQVNAAIDFNAFATTGTAIGDRTGYDLSGSKFVARVADGAIRQAIVLDGPFDLSSLSVFTANATSTVNIAAETIAKSLSLGTDVILQAHNDITVTSAIVVDNSQGDGGDLTLQAGRSVLVLNDITTDNGNLTLLANDAGADQSSRGSGEGVVLLGKDASNDDAILNFGTGTLTINGGDRFENRSNTTNPFVFDAAGGGRYVVYSSRPDRDGAPDVANLGRDVDIVGRDFLQYNLAFNPADPTPSSLPTGSGFVYSVQPDLSVNVASDTITFGETADASLTLSGVSVGGVALDAQGILDFGISSSDLLNLVDTGIAVSVTTSAGGFANAGFFAGGLTATAKPTVTAGGLFGVNVTTGAAGDLTVNKALLNADVDSSSRQYGTADSGLTISYTGFVTGDDASVLDVAPTIVSNRAIDSDIGVFLNALTASGGSDNNYTFSFTPGDLTITKKDLFISGLIGNSKIYDATTDASFSGTAVISPLAGDDVTLGGTLTALAVFTDKNVGVAKSLSVSGFVLTGNDIGNYALIQPSNLTADITQLELSLTGINASDRAYDGTVNINIGGTPTIDPIAGDLVTLSGAILGQFADKNVADDKSITLSGLSLAGTDAGNYSLSFANNLTASVSRATIEVIGATGATRFYNGTTDGAIGNRGSINPFGTDDVTLEGRPTVIYDNKNVGTNKPITVSGYQLEGADATNYTLLQPTGLTGGIEKLPVPVFAIGVLSKVYDGTTDATLSGTARVNTVAGDDVVLGGNPTARFNNKRSQINTFATISGYTLIGADASNYDLRQPSGIRADITPRPLTLSGLVASDKVYDQTTNVQVTGTATFGGIIAGDTVSIDDTGFGFAFADANAGVDKPFVFTGITLSGFDATNYDATAVSNFTGTITPVQLNINGVSVADKQYDATNTASLSGGSLAGVLGGETVNLGLTTVGSFDNKNAGSGKTVTTTGFSISGADSVNYELLQPTGLSASITQAPISITGINADRIYDGTTNATLTTTGFDSVFAGDQVVLDSSGAITTFADKNVGTNKSITFTGSFALTGIDGTNYTLIQPTNISADITQLGITVDGLTIADKVYDGTTTGVISGTGTFGGLIAGDDVAIDVGVVNIAFADKNVGTDKAVTLSGVTLTGADASNYSTTTPTGITGNITQKELSVSDISADNKTYDRTTLANLQGTGVLSGVVAGDDVSLDETTRTGTFSDKNAGLGKTVTINNLTITGADSINYSLLSVAGVQADITPAIVLIDGVSSGSQVYDGTTTAVLTGDANLDFGNLSGASDANEQVSLDGTATGTFESKDVADNKAITVSGLSLTGSEKDNYNLVLPTNLTGNVTPLSVTVAGITANDKVYDATNVASVSGIASVETLAGDEVTINGGETATFNDKNVGQAKTVILSSFSLSGSDAANYQLVQSNGLFASITPATLLIDGVVADDRPYDATTLAPLSGTPVLNTLGNDVVTLDGQFVANFANKNIGSDKTITIAGLSLSGTDADNYLLQLPQLSATVNPLDVTLTGINVDDKVYDGTIDALLNGTAQLNTISSDDVGFVDTLTGQFADRNANADISVSLTGGELSGADAANYNLILPFDLTASITPRDLTVVDLTGVDRDYDQTLSVALEGGDLENTIENDDIALDGSDASGLLQTADVGIEKTVAVDGLVLTGSDAVNYNLIQPIDVTATVSPLALDVTGIEVVEKFFDGNTDASFSGGQVQGFFSGDSVSLDTSAATASFFDATVGNDKEVQFAGLGLTGSDAANYSIDTVTVLGNILAELAEISDVVPTEVLRATSEEVLSEQREILEAFAASQEDTVTLVDFAELAPENSVSTPPTINELARMPIDQQDEATKTYVAAVYEAELAKRNYDGALRTYTSESRVHKELGAEYNESQREILVETELLDDLNVEIERVDTELATVDENISAINEAKDRIDEYTQKIQEAQRLGRGANVAEYEKIIADAEALVAQEAEVLAQKAELEQLAEESRQRLADSEQKITELEEKSETLLVEIDETEARIEEARERSVELEAIGKAANEKLERARAEGEAAVEERLAKSAVLTREAENALAGAQLAANSDIAEITARQLYSQDLGVINAQEATVKAAEAKQTLANSIQNSLGSSALSFAEELAAEATSAEGLQRSEEDIRTGILSANSELQQLEADYQAAAAEEAQLKSKMEGLFQQNHVDGFNITSSTDEAALQNAIAAMTGVDLSTVPEFDAEGNPIPELERLAIGMLQNTFSKPPEDTASEAAVSYANRVADKVLGEFGLETDEVLEDPTLLLDEAVDRVPTDKNEAIDLGTDLAAAKIRLSGTLKESAILEAEERDPTGTVKSINDVERAARDEFAASYGKQPEELLIDHIKERAGRYKDAGDSQELLAVYLEDATPEQAKMAKDAFEALARGESPEDVLKDLTSGGTSSEDRVKAAETALAAQAAAEAQIEAADKTGTVAALNDVQEAVDAEFAEAFGGTPEDLALGALKDPEAAAQQLLDVGENIFTTPDGAVAAVDTVSSAARDIATAQAQEAFNQLSKAADKLGGMGKAISAVADFGGDVVGAVSDLLGGDSGPSADEIAFMEAQRAHAEAQFRERQQAAVLEYVQAAQKIASAKYKLAVGVDNAKQQISGYVISAKVEQQRAQHEENTITATKTVIQDFVQEELNKNLETAKLSADQRIDNTLQLQAQSRVWGKTGG